MILVLISGMWLNIQSITYLKPRQENGFDFCIVGISGSREQTLEASCESIVQTVLQNRRPSR